MKIDDRLHKQVKQHRYPLLFVTISGAHLYGFPSPDSDFDLRGIHVLPLEEVIGLNSLQETVDKTEIDDGLEIDLVTHDIKKFFGMMLKNNGYVLEQLHSPLVVHSTPQHKELIAIAADCVTKNHAHHYLGFAASQWRLFSKEAVPRVKPLLYLYRVLLTGIHLMKTGKVESNLVHLNEQAKLPYISELIERKINGFEKEILEQADLKFHEKEYHRLRSELEAAFEASNLPEKTEAAKALNDLLVRVRMGLIC